MVLLYLMKKGTSYRERKFEGSRYDAHMYSYRFSYVYINTHYSTKFDFMGEMNKRYNIVVSGINIGHDGVSGS